MKTFNKTKMVYKGVEPIGIITVLSFAIVNIFDFNFTPEQIASFSSVIYGIYKMIINFNKNKNSS